MRIRKNTTLSSLLLTAGCGGERPQTHVCHFNQSPWDVIPFTSPCYGPAALTSQLDSSWFLPSSSSSSPRIHQFDGDDSFNGNVSLGDSSGAAESVVSVEKLDIIAEDNNEKLPYEEQTDQPRWRGSSSNKAKKSQKASGFKSGDRGTPASGSTTSPPRRGRPRGTGKKASAAANPYEFYYYSGFGPRWGKRRGGKSGTEEETVISNGNGDSIKNSGDYMNNNTKKSIGGEEDKTVAFGDGSSECNGLSYMEEEEEEERDDDDDDDDDDVVEQNDDSMKMIKKRGRKPVKARSLKSLM
ncbi:PREDICTED: probable serine/threonine-protein kinase ifkB isoform X1 [Tarenaya hassleriana]|uniref:probable serine/threonine-protein kinase ifkB isoform X1 n=1 Tax=Tarenaya hassleriana TaxID=28532 RepID=UPI00053C12DC|nr:PREDICTED: probable serine/threonine-protein kinase ifkB isoform X1 [Tarenaya hassleriana]